MLSIATDNGARLAAIAPAGLATLARGLGHEASAVLADAFGVPESPAAPHLGELPNLRSFVIIAVDGLGHANLAARLAHAPALRGLSRKRIETVAPSTTGAALTTLVTGRLPGTHGLVGYRIRHPEFGLRTTLSEWDGITDVREWQRSEPLFHAAARMGAQPVVIGRPAHEDSGLTRANLSGATYLSGQRMEERFALASRTVRSGEPSFVYLYIDELDRAAHAYGWQSNQWVQRLEQFDAALDDFLRTLPSDVGVVVTADHGIIDVAGDEHILMDADPELLRGVAEIGGEPRFRSLYLEPGVDPGPVARAWAESQGQLAWVGTREEFIATGCFGEMDDTVAARLGDIIIAARKRVAYYLSGDDLAAHEMVGQHGSFSEDERGVPLALGGALAGSPFVSIVTKAATAYIR